MNITQFPQCGGKVRSESIGWTCESCHGFIDMQGGFHPHREEPFMSPMTNDDRIRAMSDEELAQADRENRCVVIHPNSVTDDDHKIICGKINAEDIHLRKMRNVHEKHK